MKIKRYMAASMRAALAQVREEQGPNAVIMSSRRVDGETEVIAAVDYDEALLVGAVKNKTTAAAQAVPVAPVVPAAPVRAVPEPLVTPPATWRSAPDAGYQAVRREIRDLRELLHGELAHLSWNEKRLREPLQARVLEQLTSMDIAPDVARALAAQVPRGANTKNPAHIPLALLVRQLRVMDPSAMVEGGVVALVGPTGAGKTTTIAKLAARWSMQHGSQDLALVSTDAYRVGAREQLMSYARMLGVPMHAANNARELMRVLERLQDKKLVLIDTAGMAPRAVRLTEQLAALKSGAARARVLLTLPAQAEPRALQEIVRSFARISPTACVLTKVDEAASLGAVISTALRYRLRLAYVCDGQRVPEDLHCAHERRVWLVRTAHKLTQPAPRIDPAYFARHFGRAQAHA